MNKALLIGNLGNAPEKSITPTGVPVTKFSLATSEKYVDAKSGEKKEKVEWHKIVVWGTLADLCAKYLVKGSKVFIEGSIQFRTWEDKDGIKRNTTEIIAQRIEFLGSKQTQERESFDEPNF